jgi:hypothetical protein
VVVRLLETLCYDDSLVRSAPSRARVTHDSNSLRMPRHLRSSRKRRARFCSRQNHAKTTTGETVLAWFWHGFGTVSARSLSILARAQCLGVRRQFEAARKQITVCDAMILGQASAQRRTELTNCVAQLHALQFIKDRLLSVGE